VARVPKVVRELKFRGPRKSPDFKASITVLEGIANLLWVANELSNPQSLTHAAVARGQIWLCAFGPVVPHGCTPLD